jgi:hypothetical protein
MEEMKTLAEETPSINRVQLESSFHLPHGDEASLREHVLEGLPSLVKATPPIRKLLPGFDPDGVQGHDPYIVILFTSVI